MVDHKPIGTSKSRVYKHGIIVTFSHPFFTAEARLVVSSECNSLHIRWEIVHKRTSGHTLFVSDFNDGMTRFLLPPSTLSLVNDHFKLSVASL